MNKKVKTITSWLAAAVFLFALAINVKVTLNDPFVLLSDEAVAQTTSNSSSGSSSNQLPIVHNAIGESKSCVKEICVEWSWPTCIKFNLQMGTKVDCNPGGTLDCQPTLCL